MGSTLGSQLIDHSNTNPRWMNENYRNIIKTTDKLKKSAHVSNKTEDWANYKKYRNKSVQLKRQLKCLSAKLQLDDCTNKSKTAWRIFNDEIV